MNAYMRVVTASLLIAGLAGCSAGPAGDVEQDSATQKPPGTQEGAQPERAAPAVDESIELGSVEQAASACCSYGAYICPATGLDYEYMPPRCGFMTKPQAQTACNNACTPACTDTGWQDICE